MTPLRTDAARETMRQALLAWFERTGRDLPWRKGYAPYHVWISEIMLQQTQMERGIVYFTRWLERFPDVPAVARASEHEILKYWEGLGYYARARNLHRAAQLLVERHQGRVPDTYEELLALPGIGPYTAAAIASIAFNRDMAVVDANVERVLARLFDIGEPLKNSATKRRIRSLAAELLPPGQARCFNQALMDLGGLICMPKRPLCDDCPVAGCCAALRTGRVSQRPVVVAGGKTLLIEMATGVVMSQGRLFIQQRRVGDVWGGLWEFPGGRLEAGEKPEEAVVREYAEETGFVVAVHSPITTVVHHYMNYKVLLHGFRCRLVAESTPPRLQAAQDCRWVTPEGLSEYGFPAGHRKLITYLNAHGWESFC